MKINCSSWKLLWPLLAEAFRTCQLSPEERGKEHLPFVLGRTEFWVCMLLGMVWLVIVLITFQVPEKMIIKSNQHGHEVNPHASLLPPMHKSVPGEKQLLGQSWWAGTSRWSSCLMTANAGADFLSGWEGAISRSERKGSNQLPVLVSQRRGVTGDVQGRTGGLFH